MIFKLAIVVLDFYRRPEGKVVNPFLSVLHSPIFYILVKVNGKIRELVIKTSEDIKCPRTGALRDFQIEGYRNYLMITDFLLGENREIVRRKWGLTKEDFKELIFELYCTLLNRYTTCGVFKRALLYIIGMWKFHIGRKLVC